MVLVPLPAGSAGSGSAPRGGTVASAGQPEWRPEAGVPGQSASG